MVISDNEEDEDCGVDGRVTEKLPNNRYKVNVYQGVITEMSEDKLMRRFENLRNYSLLKFHVVNLRRCW